jgi:hypothetical protein
MHACRVCLVGVPRDPDSKLDFLPLHAHFLSVGAPLSWNRLDGLLVFLPERDAGHRWEETWTGKKLGY